MQRAMHGPASSEASATATKLGSHAVPPRPVLKFNPLRKAPGRVSGLQVPPPLPSGSLSSILVSSNKAVARDNLVQITGNFVMLDPYACSPPGTRQFCAGVR